MGKIRSILGNNVRTLRTNKGWTQVYVADRLQITAPFLAQIESGKRGTSLELIESIAELFNIPIASLFLEQTEIYMEAKVNMRKIKLITIEKQLQEIISENIKKAFEKLK
ncbi:helix-turn-helix domain-containing protein [Treponema sp. Marseille-Q4523]|uniref:helix-turn-helix domain-containing protein n=1 Tax=Treponema sp. Marseille-Q4523 TaxID=2810610 RepID=UPI00195FEFBC|nr:helix-turn-helix transcriptional regulator [Treponema sp. Marseille-Q4523]MBM7024211.1 helix-turn-helix transcriptional regulator [Treponema sp. Marseille-Q4523]